MLKTNEITITAEGRDKGRRYFVTEMPAVKFARWVTRAVFSIQKGGGNVPANVLEEGFAGLVAFGLQAIASCSFADAEPLLDELMDCVQFLPDPKSREPRPGKLMSNEVDEWMTFFTLRREVIELHLGFTIAAEWLKYRQRLATAGDASSTPTYPELSPSSQEVG